MKDLLLSLQSEFYKSRKTLGFWSAILLPVLICLLVFWHFYTDSVKMSGFPAMLLWLRYAGSILNVMGTLLLPMLVIFICYSVNSIEHKADTWKTLFSLPISKWAVYSAKFIYALLLIAICLSLFYALTMASANLLGNLKPEFRFADYDMKGALLQIYFKLFLSALGILSIQFLLSLLWSDFLKPMGVGFVATLSGLILVGFDWKYDYLIPYAHPSLTVRSIMPRRGMMAIPELKVEIFTDYVYVSLIVCIAVFIAGFYIVQKKSVK
ncbi:MAG: ABC transporter permease [Mucilaginibacter sp.]